MRPDSIMWFERLYLGSLALLVFNLIFTWDALVAEAAAVPNVEAVGSPATFLTIILAFSFGIQLLLLFFIARRASRIAQWILVAFFAYALITLPGLIQQGGFQGTTGAITAIGWLLQGAALILLFRVDARAWFRGEWREPTIAGTFE